MTEEPPRIRRYRIVSTIGRGGIATVYRAVDDELNREVAIKVLATQFSRDSTFQQRLRKEAIALASLNHPYIVPIYDIGSAEDGQLYIVMSYLAGGSLTQRLRNGPLQAQTAVDILERIGIALDYAHKHGMLHHALKPDNILFDQQGNAYLSDFGVARLADTVILSGATSTGTPAYMSPEQAQGQSVLDGRSDIYALGVILFEMITGVRPYRGKSTIEILLQHVRNDIPSLRDANPSLSPDYEPILARALAKNPQDRYFTAGELVAAFALTVNAIGVEAPPVIVVNPFVVGNPVEGELFVGRAETFRRLNAIWGNDATQSVNSVVLFGHRRMGKTSILQNLSRQFGDHMVVAYLTMQRVGRVQNTGELLSYLALALYDALQDAGLDTLPEPDPAHYASNGYHVFNRFLRAVQRELAPHTGTWPRLLGRLRHPAKSAPRAARVVLAIDEFELIETAIAEGRVDAEVLDFLRGVIHSESWLVLVLAGLHTLEEMTANYWNPLYASVTPVHVSFLSRADTARLLNHPVAEFPLAFPNATVDHIYALVRGQPYLTQLIAHDLVNQYNAYIEAGRRRSPQLAPDDVDALVSSDAFYSQGSYYFNGVWMQAERSGASGQTALLTHLAQADRPTAGLELVRHAGLDEITGQAALNMLRHHDVLVRDADGRYEFAVPLMRRWIHSQLSKP